MPLPVIGRERTCLGRGAFRFLEMLARHVVTTLPNERYKLVFGCATGVCHRPTYRHGRLLQERCRLIGGRRSKVSAVTDFVAPACSCLTDRFTPTYPTPGVVESGSTKVRKIHYIFLVAA